MGTLTAATFGNIGIASNAWTTAGNTYTIKLNQWGSDYVGVAEGAVRSNLDWLDERVNEMRVKL